MSGRPSLEALVSVCLLGSMFTLSGCGAALKRTTTLEFHVVKGSSLTLHKAMGDTNLIITKSGYASLPQRQVQDPGCWSCQPVEGCRAEGTLSTTRTALEQVVPMNERAALGEQIARYNNMAADSKQVSVSVHGLYWIYQYEPVGAEGMAVNSVEFTEDYIRLLLRGEAVTLQKQGKGRKLMYKVQLGILHPNRLHPSPVRGPDERLTRG